jgi:hypothetical protein
LLAVPGTCFGDNGVRRVSLLPDVRGGGDEDVSRRAVRSARRISRISSGPSSGGTGDSGKRRLTRWKEKEMVEGFVRRGKPSQGRIRHDIRVDRYWKSKKTGTKVEVTKLMLVDNTHLQVIFFDELRGAEFSLALDEMQSQYEPAGNTPSGSDRNVTFRKTYKQK